MLLLAMVNCTRIEDRWASSEHRTLHTFHLSSSVTKIHTQPKLDLPYSPHRSPFKILLSVSSRKFKKIAREIFLILFTVCVKRMAVFRAPCQWNILAARYLRAIIPGNKRKLLPFTRKTTGKLKWLEYRDEKAVELVVFSPFNKINDMDIRIWSKAQLP